jgi:hypothetical protein
MTLGTGEDQAVNIDPEPPRIRRLRTELVKTIPRVPNDRASLVHMQQKPLVDLIIDYVNWCARYIGARPRTITVEPAAQADPRWAAMAAPIEAFLNKVRRGEDLTPHLSIKPHTRGYAPAARAAGAAPEDRWSDKDFLLHSMNYHHFHLDATGGPGGHGQGPDDLIFAEVTRDTFKVIAIFRHEVFDHDSPERMRLWAAHESSVSRSVPPGSLVIAGAITTSGHTLHAVQHAQHCARLIADIEPKLDDPAFVGSLYVPSEEAPPRPKPEWAFAHLDLAIYDRAKPALLIVHKGWT